MYIYDRANSVALIAERQELDFYHQDSCLIPSVMSAFQAYCDMTAEPPAWIRLAFQARDFLGRLAGIKAIGGFTISRPVIAPDIGSELDFFTVANITDDELLLLSTDRHLSVLVSIQVTEKSLNTSKLIITASVKNKNLLGSIYMLPVGPAHSMIVENMLNKIRIDP